MVDFVKMQALAKRLIEENGRSMTVVKVDETPSDGAKPWRGNSAPNNPPADTTTIIGVFVEPGSLKNFGFEGNQDTLGNIRFDKIVLCAHTSGNKNLETFDHVLDGANQWRIIRAKVLQPGTERIIYALGLLQ